MRATHPFAKIFASGKPGRFTPWSSRDERLKLGHISIAFVGPAEENETKATVLYELVERPDEFILILAQTDGADTQQQWDGIGLARESKERFVNRIRHEPCSTCQGLNRIFRVARDTHHAVASGNGEVFKP